MSGLCDKAIKSNYAENKYRGNGGSELQNKEFSDGSGLEVYDANFRGYDPQIGRFWQQDALADANESWSPYSFVNDNPISFNDPLGLTDSVVGLKPYAPAPIITPTHVHTPNNKAPDLAFVGDPPGGVNAPSAPTAAPDISVNNPGPEIQPVGEPTVSPLLPGLSPLAGILTIVGVSIPAGGPSFPNGDEGYFINHKGYVTAPFVGHANRKDNTDPHIVYAFGFAAKDGRTPILKYGISDEYRYSFDRPESQLAKLRAQYGPSVMFSIYERTISRQMALMVERKLVTDHVRQWGEMPREQDRPSPF
jgi:RHS repeat-associated protein